MPSKTPRIAITVGEPAGIGPDLCLKLALTEQSADIVFIADPQLLRERASLLGLNVEIPLYQAEQKTQAGFTCLPVQLINKVTPGVLDAENANYVLQTLELAASGCMTEQFDAMVTAPVHKGIINDAGIDFSGHTEFLEALTQSPQSVMMLATPKLRVALVTTHLPLSKVSKAITKERLHRVIQVLHHDLQHHFGLSDPKILVCGLNPHAGENGYLGREEIDVITPVLENLRQKGLQLTGPLPADTAFTLSHLSGHDVVLSMYHDQGLPVLKHQGFGKAVNITLGLPIIRTSVDHGTALELAGSGKAEAGSLMAAVSTAISMTSPK